MDKLWWILPTIFGAAMVSYFLFVVLVAFPGIDRYEEIARKQHDKDAQECRDKGGIPIMSIWDGRLEDCKFKEIK